MAKKKTELMEEENKKDFLDEESMEGERVFLMDEKGEILIQYSKSSICETN